MIEELKNKIEALGLTLDDGVSCNESINYYVLGSGRSEATLYKVTNKIGNTILFAFEHCYDKSGKLDRYVYCLDINQNRKYYLGGVNWAGYEASDVDVIYDDLVAKLKITFSGFVF